MEEFRDAAVRLREEGHHVRPRLTFEAGDAARFAASAARARFDLVVAAGGDGTINEVVNGLRRSRWQPRLGVVPTGTANDFATGLGVPEDIVEALRVAVGGRPRAVDVARVNRRCFINVSTGGFGADTADEASTGTKRVLGSWAYLVTGAKEFVEMKTAAARFVADGATLHDGPFLLFAVGNARQTGGGSFLTPRAEQGDGRLDVLVVPEMSRVDFLALLPDLRAGTHLQSRDVIYGQARRLDVTSDEELKVNADGEPLRARRLRYLLEDRPLTVMVP